MAVTPNGALVYLVLCVIVLFAPTRFALPFFALVPIVGLVLQLSPQGMYRAGKQAVMVTAPLFAFLVVVWVIVVRTAPTSVLFVSSGVSLSALEYVGGIASRLFLFTLLVAALVQQFLKSGAVAFVQGLSVPASAKAVVLTTLSLKNTIAQAASRAHTALVAARVLTLRPSWLNVRHGWRLVQGVWMATLSMALERLDSKWQLEGLPEGFSLGGEQGAVYWDRKDLQWAALPVAAGLLAVAFG